MEEIRTFVAGAMQYAIVAYFYATLAYIKHGHAF